MLLVSLSSPYSMFLWHVCTPDRLHLVTIQNTTILNIIDHVEKCILWPACVQVLSNKSGKVEFDRFVGNRFYWIDRHKKRDSRYTFYCRFQYEISPKFIGEVSEIKLQLVKRGRSDMSISQNIHFMNKSYKNLCPLFEDFPVREFLECFFLSYNLIHG